MNYKQLGWTEEFEKDFAPYSAEGLTPGRVALEHKGMYRVWSEDGEMLAEVSGKFRFQAGERGDYPAVGDWVALSARTDEGKATIHAVLPRKSKFSRKIAGETTEEQIVAANVDTVFLVTALNADFNVRRMERYMIMAWESGANPVIILSKADLCDNPGEKAREMEAVALGVPVHVISAESGLGLDELSHYIGEGRTIALLGSSGVGKSTLVNAFSGGDAARTGDIRESDDRGKHTTTHREMIMLAEGGLLIDTPGMRELQLWGADTGLGQSFADIEELAACCRFRDCSHNGEPGCAVCAALEDGSLESERYKSYTKLQRELAYLERKEVKSLALAEKNKWKKISMFHKQKKTRK